MQTYFKSIRFKIILISIITLVIALAISSVFNYYQSRRNLENYMELTITSLATSIGNEVSLWLDGRKTEVNSAALAFSAYATRAEKLAFMQKIVENGAFYETMFFADEKGDYFITMGENGNVKDREYFQKVMAGQTVISDPVTSRATGRNVIVAAAPVKENDKVVGLLGLTVSLDELSDRIVTTKIGKTGYPYLIQGDGLVIAHPNKELTMKMNAITDDTLDSKSKKAMLDIMQGSSRVSRLVFEGVDKYVSYAPIPGVSWGAVITVPVDELHEQLASIPLPIFIMAIAIAFLAAVVSNIFLARLISNPVKNIQKIIGEASQGDLTARGTLASQDEIGQLTADFNNFMDKIQAMINNINENTAAFNRSLDNMFAIARGMIHKSEEMNDKTNAVNQAVRQITASIGETAAASSATSDSINLIASAMEEMHSTIQRQASAAEEIYSSIEHVSQGAGQISASISNISLSAQDMSASVNSVATAVKEINSSLSEISVNCERSTQITGDAENKTRETKIIIGALKQSSQQIGRIVGVINSIADQTNMLALNAAIEAAGAGEAGRGFAVVANEVKELAKQTAEATEEISRQIETMQSNMSNAVKAMETITQVNEEINIITGTIASAVAEQSATTGEISRSVIQAAEKVNLISTEIGEVAANSRQAANSVAEVSEGVHEIARSTNELALAANEVAENAVKASSMVTQVAQEAAEISRGASEIAGSIQEIDQASSERVAVAEEASSSTGNLIDLFGKLEAMSKQFKA